MSDEIRSPQMPCDAAGTTAIAALPREASPGWAPAGDLVELAAGFVPGAAKEAPAPRSEPSPSLVSVVARVVVVLLLTVVGALVLVADVPLLWGWHPQVVVSGSMSPAVRAGAVTLVDRNGAAAVRPGDVVLVVDPTRETGTYLHRVVRIETDGSVTTKGDANPTDDYPSVVPAHVLGRLHAVVPVLGLPVVWWREGHAALAVLPVLVVAAAAALLPTRGGRLPGRRRRSAAAQVATPATGRRRRD